MLTTRVSHPPFGVGGVDEAGNQGRSRSAHGMTQRGSFRGLNGIVRLSEQPEHR